MGLAQYAVMARGGSWTVLHDGDARNDYETKEAAFEAAVAAASLAIREGHEIHISVPDRSAGNRSLLGAKRIECATIDCVWMDHAQSLAVVP